MAATDPREGPSTAAVRPGERSRAGGVLLAALALPGLAAPSAVFAETAPEDATMSFKQLHYEDSQTGLRRIHVDAPSIYVLTPIGENWALEGSAVVDIVSGASPRYYTTVSGASHMFDRRIGEDAQLTYYRTRSNYAVSLTHSKEDDYESYGASVQARFSSADNNTTFNVGAGASLDTINPVNQIVVDQHKHTADVIAGVTQALSPYDLAQIQIGYTLGHGYYDDPYKLFDARPRKRNQGTALLRWNHHFKSVDGTLRTSYRWCARCRRHS